MEIHFLPGQNFTCSECARCCRSGWRIHVDPATQERVEGSYLALRVQQEYGLPVFRRQDDGTLITASRPHDGACVFLNPESRCAIHAEMGRQAKPLGCRQFPFMVVPTPEGVRVGISFYCTAAQRNQGLPLERYEPEIHELLRGIRFARVPERGIPVAGEVAFDWEDLKTLETFLDQALQRIPPGLALGRSLFGLCHWLQGGAPQGRLREHLESPQADRLLQDEVMGSLTAFFVASVLGLLEKGEGDPRTLTEAFFYGGRVWLARLGWQGDTGQIVAYGATPPEWLDAEIARYLRNLVFRQFLALERPVLDNLAALFLLPTLLRWYTAAYGLARGKERPGREEYYAALDVAEMDLVTHTRGLERLFAAFSAAFTDQVKAFSSGESP
ncbi:MAG TPA: YkgJ family cysteine cluster protein [Candidatus Nitrosotenuis sp.]|nr:YkgJ family cysteine cluster protein [Candidatus Nitrosotenuis sp.]